MTDGPASVRVLNGEPTGGKPYRVDRACWSKIIDDADSVPPCLFGGEDGSVHKTEKNDDVMSRAHESVDGAQDRVDVALQMCRFIGANVESLVCKLSAILTKGGIA